MRRNAIIISTFSVFAFAIAGWYYGADPLDCSLRALAAGVGVYILTKIYLSLAERIMSHGSGQMTQIASRVADGDVDGQSNNT